MGAKQSVRATNEAFWDGTLTVGLVAVALPNVHSTHVLVQADPNNGGNVFVGTVNSQSVQLTAGATETIPIDTPSKIYVRGSAADQRVNWHAAGS